MSKKKKINYDNWSKDDLVKEIKRIKETTYGLVWHRDVPEEKIDILINPDARIPEEMFANEVAGKPFPVLKEIKGKEIVSDEKDQTHLMIEGDNYHALAVLNFTHQESIDVIYIDPPYNIGNKDFIYTDKYDSDYVAKDDPFRHSKWLSFMEKRLKLAQKLLKKEGLIFISIDDNEQAPLKMLCDEIFGENNFIANITIQGSANESNEGVMFQSVTEYLLCYAKDKSVAKINKIDAVSEDWRSLNDAPSGLSSRRQMGYTIYYNPDTKDVIPKIDYDTNGDFSDLENIYKDDKELLRKGYTPIRPKPRNGTAWRWRWGMETLIERKDELQFRQNRNGDWVVEFGQSGFNAPRDYQEFGTGTTELKKIFGGKEVFNKPKSTEFIKWVLEVGANKSATVLDFMGGSGTTGHAVLSLNKEDGGKRQFILCTNNENGIATEVCHPRLKKVINGYKTNTGNKIDGLGGNLKYFTAYDFVESEPTDKNKRKLVKKSTEMLCIKEGVYDLVKETEEFKILKNPQGKYLGIVFYEDAIDDYKKEIKKLKDKIITYVFSLGDDPHRAEFKDVADKVELQPIPEVILRVYREIFK